MKISQRESRRLSKRVDELERIIERQRLVWAMDAFGGVHLTTMIVPAEDRAAVVTARKLSHAVVVTFDSGDRLRLYALPVAKALP